jgi:hypothetical protein
MLRIETLSRKSKLVVRDEEIVDLTKASIKYKNTPRIKRSIIISDDLVMRPDAVARIVYGSANMLDYLLKFNDISNPFAIDSGDILLIPNEDDMRDQFIDAVPEENKDDLRIKLLDPSKFNKKDQARLDYIKKKTKDKKNPLPPNFATQGTNEISVKDGKIVFGDNVTGNASNCPEPVSRASLKSKLLANKIFRGG